MPFFYLKSPLCSHALWIYHATSLLPGDSSVNSNDSDDSSDDSDDSSDDCDEINKYQNSQDDSLFDTEPEY